MWHGVHPVDADVIYEWNAKWHDCKTLWKYVHQIRCKTRDAVTNIYCPLEQQLQQCLPCQHRDTLREAVGPISTISNSFAMTLESIPSHAPRALRVARLTSRRSTRTASSSAGRCVHHKDALDLPVLHPRRNVAICRGGPRTRRPLSSTTTSSSAILRFCYSKKADPGILLFSH